jgi:uncharacterized protein YjiS (DUF1127 family)
MSGSMAAYSSASPLRAPARMAVGARFGALLRTMMAFLAAEWRARRDLAQLQAMDARALHDIGLTRGSLEGAIRHGSRGPAPSGPAPAERPRLPSSLTEWR